MTKDNEMKQVIQILERSAILLLIIALVIIMTRSSKQIKTRREAYIRQGQIEEVQRRGETIQADTQEESPAEQIEGNEDFYFNEGLRFARAGRFDGAIEAFEKAIEIDPLHYRAMSNLGLVYKNIFLTNRDPGLLEKAIELYNKAISVNSGFPDVYNNLGDAYFNQEKYDEAEGAFKEAIRLDPLSANAYNNLGVALIMQDKKDEALEAWRKSLEINPDQPKIEEYIGRNE